jgi:hypothetical protein
MLGEGAVPPEAREMGYSMIWLDGTCFMVAIKARSSYTASYKIAPPMHAYGTRS